MKKFFLFFLLSVLLSTFFTPLLVSAATNPQDNPICWSETSCEDYNKDGKIDGIWDNTSTKAVNTCGGSLGYCYPKMDDFELSVSLPITGTVTRTIGDFGDYINKMYVLLLGTLSIIVVINFMVAGVQYVIAPAGGDVAKAKDKMKNSSIGLVLLICSALILATVNPQLLNLNPPPTPKIRTVVLFGDDSLCSLYISQSYTVEPDLSSEAASCGKESKVTKDPNGMALTEETTCVWTGCDDYTFSTGSPFKIKKTCLPGATVSGETYGPKGACVTCDQMTPDDSPVSGITMSDSLCSTLKPEFSDSNPSEDWHADCVFNKDINFEATDFIDIKADGQCAFVNFNCADIDECEDYDRIIAWNHWGSQYLDAFEAPGFFYDYSYHKQICEGNPCGISGGCRQDRSPRLEALLATAAIASPAFGIGMTLSESLLDVSMNGLSCDPASMTEAEVQASWPADWAESGG